MLISVSESASADDAHHTRFKTIEATTMRDVARVMCGKRHWSPIVWTDGYRRSSSFGSCELLVLDFDDGTTGAAEFAESLRADGWRFVLGATRNHRVEKNGVVCDRFRVAIPFSSPITDLATYKQNMIRILSAFPCDQGCTDGARKYRPCSSVIHFGDGEPAVWLPYEPPPPPSPNAMMRNRIMRAKNEIPAWVHDAISSDTPGERNRRLFRVAAKLTQYGFEEAEVIRIIQSSAASIPDKEKENVARQGIRAGKAQGLEGR